MKNILLIIGLFVGLSLNAQTLILTDTLYVNQDTVYLNWYHQDYGDSDNPFELHTDISLTKLTASGYEKKVSVNKVSKFIDSRLRQGDSLKNPYGENYFKYDFVKNYIYNNGEGMKRTLSLYFLLNQPERILQ